MYLAFESILKFWQNIESFSSALNVAHYKDISYNKFINTKLLKRSITKNED